MRKRLTSEERKRIIQVKAMEIFLEKGYKNTTMQDIVKASGLSIGGLYHHYKKTSEILYDIMVLGCEYRFNEIDKQVEVQSGNLTMSCMVVFLYPFSRNISIALTCIILFLSSLVKLSYFQAIQPPINVTI